MPRILGAVRLSKLTDETTSPERQRDQIRRYAELYGHTVVAVAEDLDVSGSVSAWNRDLEPWLTDPERVGLWDVLIVAKLDRLTRSIVDFGKLLEWCQSNGKTIVSVAEGLDFSTAAGRLFANILVMFAQFERERIGERTAEAKKALKAQGYWTGGTVKYGQRPVKDGDHWTTEVDPEQYRHLERMAQDLIAGKSATQLCRELIAEGVPTQRGGTWYSSTILDILRDPECVLDSEIWTSARDVIDGISKPRNNRYDAVALSGVAFCGKCEAPLYGHHDTCKGKQYAYYRCSGKCGAKLIPAHLVENGVDDAVTETYGYLPHTERKLIPGDDNQRTIKDLARQIQALDPLADDYDEKFPLLHAELARVREMPSEPDRYESVPTGQTLAQWWPSTDSAAKRRYLERLGWKAFITAQNHRRGELPVIVLDAGEFADDLRTLQKAL